MHALLDVSRTVPIKMPSGPIVIGFSKARPYINCIRKKPSFEGRLSSDRFKMLLLHHGFRFNNFSVGDERINAWLTNHKLVFHRRGLLPSSQ
jgi:hypothetical protein